MAAYLPPAAYAALKNELEMLRKKIRNFKAPRGVSKAEISDLETAVSELESIASQSSNPSQIEQMARETTSPTPYEGFQL